MLRITVTFAAFFSYNQCTRLLIKTNIMRKTLILFRLYDLSYSRNGEFGNKETLRVILGEDNVLSYSLFGGWQDSGTPFAISNLQLQKSLPSNPADFKNIRDLEYELRQILKTGVGSHTVNKAEVLNQLKEKAKPKVKSLTLKAIKELKEQAQELIDLGDSREKAEGYGMKRVLSMLA